jgi:tetratricopeptide (TPR) repeat protein
MSTKQDMQKQPVETSANVPEPISLSLNSVPAMLEKAKAQLQEGRPEEALQILNAAIGAAPGVVDSWHAKALVLRQLGRPDEAVKVLDTALQQIGAKPSLLMDKAGFHLLKGDFAGARDTFDRLIKLEPQNPEAWLGKARTLLNDGSAEQAMDCAERAIMLDPRSTRGYSLRGDCLLTLQRWADAFAAFAEAAKDDPDQFDASSWAARGDQFRQHEQPEFALNAYERAISQEPGNPKGWHGKGTVLKGYGDSKGALAAFERASDVDETFIDGLLDAGRLCFESGEPDRALSFFQRWQQAKQDDPRPWKYAGWVLQKLGHNDDAQTAYAHATILDKDDAEAWGLLGGSLYNLDRLDEASRSYQRAIEVKPNYALAHYSLAFVRLRQRRFDEAIQSIDRAIELAPDEGSFWVDRLWFLNQIDKIEESEVDALADQALEKIGPNTDLQLLIAHFLADCGRLARARDLMESVTPSPTEDERERLARAELLLKVGDTDPALGLIRDIDATRLGGYDPVTFSFLHLLADRLAGAPQLSEELLVNFLHKLTQQVDHIDAGALWSLKGVRLLLARAELSVLDKLVLKTLIDLQEAKINLNELSFFAEFPA